MQDKNCKCGGIISLVHEHEDFAKFYHCNKCRHSELVFNVCVQVFSTFKVRWDNGSIHVVTKCKICGRHGKAHKKSDFNLNELPFFDQSIEESHYEKHRKAREEFSKVQQQIVIDQKKAKNSWNIEKWY